MSGNSFHDDMHSTAAHYQELTDYTADRYADSAVAESRPPLFVASSSQIHPHPLFTRHDGINSRSLEPHGLTNYQSPSLSTSHHHPPHSPDHDSPHSWPPYSHPFPQTQQGPQSYAPFPSPSPFPPPRLSPPPVHHQSFHFKGQGLTAGSTTAGHRMTLAGSLDPNTGIFYRTPEHPRLRTAQACEKCRTRKAKCSGEHPSCKRCITRGLVCEYAKEGRVRGPNKPKGKAPAGSAASATSLPTASNSNSPNTQSSSTTNGRTTYRNRTSSNHSSADSRESDRPDSIPPSVRSALLRTDNVPDGLSSGRGGRGSSRSRRNSHSGTLGDHFPSRSRTVHEFPFETAPNVFRLNGESTGPMSAPPLSLERGMEANLFPFSSDRHERVGMGMGPWENMGHQQKFQRGLGIVAHPDSQAQGDLVSRSQYHGSATLLSPLVKDVVPRGMSQTHGHSNESETLIGNHPQNLLPMGMNVGFQAGPSSSIDDHEFIYPQSYDPLSTIVGSQHAHTHMASPGADAASSRLGSPLVPISGGAATGIIERHRLDYPLESQPHHHHRGRNHRNEDVRFDMDTTLRVSQPQFISQRSPFPHPGMVVDHIVTDEHGHGYAKTNGHSDMEHTFDGQTTHSGQQGGGGIDLHC